MIEVERCNECGVPRQVADDHQWLDSGVIVLKSDPHLRMAFAESENLDYLFDVIEELIEVPIEHLLIDIERKGTRDYFNPLIPREVKDMLKSRALGLDPIIDALIMTNRINGLGNYDLVSYRYELDNDDYITVVSYNAYSVPLALGDMAGGCEAVVEREYSKVSHKEVTAGVYEMTAAVSGVPAELQDRLELKEYHLRKGEVALERCATCGCPSALREFKWDLDRGTITSALNGRRMAIVHPSVIDPVFEELEAELGEEIPNVVIEAQRQITRSGFFTIDEIADGGRFADHLALRGMGNLTEFEMNARGLHLELDNVCMHLMVAGMVQGLFEMSYGVESDIEWELTEEGDLRVEVTPEA